MTLLHVTPLRGTRGTLEAIDIGPKAIPDKESGMRVFVEIPLLVNKNIFTGQRRQKDVQLQKLPLLEIV